jgi:hypothetical protein
MNTSTPVRKPGPFLPYSQIPERAIQALMKEQNFDRLVALRHLQQRYALFGPR